MPFGCRVPVVPKAGALQLSSVGRLTILELICKLRQKQPEMGRPSEAHRAGLWRAVRPNIQEIGEDDSHGPVTACHWLEQGQMRVIEAGWCHRISTPDRPRAAFLFVKTNPALEPRSEDCEL
jgi:hypothetical protein